MFILFDYSFENNSFYLTRFNNLKLSNLRKKIFFLGKKGVNTILFLFFEYKSFNSSKISHVLC